MVYPQNGTAVLEGLKYTGTVFTGTFITFHVEKLSNIFPEGLRVCVCFVNTNVVIIENG